MAMRVQCTQSELRTKAMMSDNLAMTLRRTFFRSERVLCCTRLMSTLLEQNFCLVYFYPGLNSTLTFAYELAKYELMPFFRAIHVWN